MAYGIAQITAIGVDGPIFGIDRRPEITPGGECNARSIGRPDGNAHRDSRVVLVSYLPQRSIAQVLHPDISMTAAVREKCNFGVIGRGGRSLHLSGLLSNAQSALRVRACASIDGELPDV